jgi:hypothetical protein
MESPLKLTIIFSYNYYHPHLLLSLIKKASKIARLHGPRTGLGKSTWMVDEKVTVVSSFFTLLFFVTEAGNAIAALGNFHEGNSHILK